MPLHNRTLQMMIGAVKLHKPFASSEQCRYWLNKRLHDVLSRRNWADLQTRVIISSPAEYRTGTVSLSHGSRTVTGQGTDWNPTDLISTILPDGVSERGRQTVEPASMTGISRGAYLSIDGTGTFEVVRVLDTTPTGFVANFQYDHNPDCTVTSSKLCGRQLRVSGQMPLYTIASVRAADQIELDMPWQGDDKLAVTYSIRKAYYQIAPDIRDIVGVVDPQHGVPVQVHRDRRMIDMHDPRRTAVGNRVMAIVDHHSDGVDMLYEFWPHPVTHQQFEVAIVRQWPDMVDDGDVPLPFLNPDILVEGAIADALLTRIIDNSTSVDPYYDPAASDRHEQRYEALLRNAVNEDDGKSLQSLTRDTRGSGYFGDTAFGQANDYDALTGNY